MKGSETKMVTNQGLFFCCSALVLLLLANCQPPQSPTRAIANSAGGETTQQEDLPSIVVQHYPQIIDPWRRFKEKGNYRMARFSDFQFSKEAIGRMSGYDSRWREKLDQPYIFGDITRLGPSSDLAMIVVAGGTEDPDQKFGLIVFNAKPDGSLSDANWVSREPSLATTTLGWSGNWPAVFRYRPDGSVERLFINWNPRTDTYSIDTEQIGVGARKSEGP